MNIERKRMKKILQKSELFDIFPDFEINCLDIGSRGGILDDLNPISSNVNLFGCEPATEEWERLSDNLKSEDWNSVKNFPEAVGENFEERKLYICNKEGCSSLLKPLSARASNFKRGAYYQIKKSETVSTKTLQKLKSDYNLARIDYVKIDVQGLEKEICEATRDLFEKEILFVRCEITFEKFYEGQTFPENIFEFFRRENFIFLDFEEIHKWRVNSRRKNGEFSKKDFPFSRPQFIHGDVLMAKDPFEIANSNLDSDQVVRLFFILLSYGFIGHAFKVVDNSDAFDQKGKIKNELLRISRAISLYELAIGSKEFFVKPFFIFKQLFRLMCNYSGVYE